MTLAVHMLIVTSFNDSKDSVMVVEKLGTHYIIPIHLITCL